MIKVTKLDNTEVLINEKNIQWIEKLPDTVITFLGGTRLFVRQSPDEVLALMEHSTRAEMFLLSKDGSAETPSSTTS